jgi:hypothetical protein
LNRSQFVRRDAQAKVLLDTRVLGQPFQLPPAVWADPLPPHSVENIGTADLRLISVELKGS